MPGSESNGEREGGFSAHGRGRGYASNLMGRRIVNAETGVPTSHHVGSIHENIYFKVADASRRNETGDSDVFFYDSPDQYVRHRFKRIRYYKQGESNFGKMRKEQMLDESSDGNGVVQWSLMTAGGEDGSEYRNTKKRDVYMVPRLNQKFANEWYSKRSEFLSRFGNSNDTETDSDA